MFFEILILAIGFVILLDYFVKRRRNDITCNLPGPMNLPILGNALSYVNKSPDDIMEYIFKNRNKYGPLYKVWIFNQLAIFSCNPKDIEIVLSSPKYIQKNKLYDLLHTWLGQGLLLSSGSKWHSRRKIITPTFHFKILEQFVEIFDQQSAILVEKLKSKVDSGEFNIHPFICLEALDIIAETAMGTKINAQTESDNEYAHAVTEITNIIAKRFVNVWQRFVWVFLLTAPKTKIRQDKALKILHSFAERIIEERRNTLEQSLTNQPIINTDNNDVGTKKRMALLDILLQSTDSSGKSLTNLDIREEVDTFMFEGHDTTTSGISFALFCISRHPDVQKKLFTEIREILGSDKDKPISYRDLQNLKYLDCVIKETLRLYPPVPMIGRYFTEDVDLNGKIIPAGTNYTIGLYVMFRDPVIFEDPDSFKPDRHSTENTTENTNPYAYIPFSAGPRNCIGQKFAMLEMKSTISKILRHYELLPLGPDMKPMMNLVMRSSNGVHLGLKTRIY